MLRTEVQISVENCSAGANPLPSLKLHLTSYTPCWVMNGTLEIKGLSAHEVEVVEDQIVRRLGGRAVLSLGPAESGVSLECDPGRSMKLFSQHWGMTAEGWVEKTGLTMATVTRILNAKSGTRLREHTRLAFSAAMSRIIQNPMLGEYLRFRRISSNHSAVGMADKLGVSVEQLCDWEEDREAAPSYILELLREYYENSSSTWTSATAVRGILAPLTMTTPPPWGSKSRAIEVHDGELAAVEA